MKEGTIKQLWRFPVKSFKGELLKKAEFESAGMLGDRAYALLEKESGKVVTAKSVKYFPNLLDCKAEFIEEPKPGKATPPVKITLPNGNSAFSDSGKIDQMISEYYNREVTLASKTPADYTVDQYHPDVDKIHPAGFRDVSIEQKLGSALFAELGLDSAIPVGSFMDMFPASVITSSTLNNLKALSPISNFDIRRFRMNIVIETNEAGFIENGWIKKTLSIGKEVKIMVAMPDPRCVMTTLAQGAIKKDTTILKTLAQHNRIDVGGGEFPCAGVYAVIISPGAIHVGDRVELI